MPILVDMPSERPIEDRWLYEQIVENVPPFKWLPPRLDILAQLMLVETIGIFAFLYFQMPTESLIFGSLAILYTVIWSAGCLYVIPLLRKLKNPTNEKELMILRSYKQNLLENKMIELIGSIACFIGISSYLIYDQDLLQRFLGQGYGNLFLYALILILSWDIAYRLWLSFFTTFSAARRSIALARAAKERRGLKYTAYSEVQTLISLDIINLYWAGSAILLLPIALSSQLLFFSIIAFFGSILVLSFISLLSMETIPWFPPDVENILFQERFAYVAVYDKKTVHTTPVIFVYDGKYIYFAISVKSAKYRLIKKNNSIAVLVDMRDSKNPMNNRSVLLRGKGLILGQFSPFGIARLLIYGLWLLRVRSLFRRKYPMYLRYYKEQAESIPLAWKEKPFVSRVVVRLQVKSAIYWRKAAPTFLRV